MKAQDVVNCMQLWFPDCPLEDVPNAAIISVMVCSMLEHKIPVDTIKDILETSSDFWGDTKTLLTTFNDDIFPSAPNTEKSSDANKDSTSPS